MAKEAAMVKRMVGPSKQSTRKTILRKASKVMPIQDMEMVSDGKSEDTLGASQSKLQEYKDMWALEKAGQIPAGYIKVSLCLIMPTPKLTVTISEAPLHHQL